MAEGTAGLTLTLRARFHAPRDRVFAALTDPAELATWWGPHDITALVTKFDLRVRGGYRFRMQPRDGAPFHLSGEFLEIDPPRRLGYTFRWEEPTRDDRETVVTLWLDAVEDTTTLKLIQGEFATEERLALHEGGWTESFEKLRAVVGPATRR